MSNNDKTILESFLDDEEDGVSKFDKENAILQPLLPEIELIQDQHIKYWVRSILLKAGVFWEIPASFSGNHHPPDEHGIGGNVLHTKRVVRIAGLICDSYGTALNTMIEYPNHLVRDMILAAALIHDVTKGRVWAEGMEPMYDKMHPYTIDEFVDYNVYPQDLLVGDNESSTLYLDDDAEAFIKSLVHSHLGRWSPIPETYPANIPAMILHLADNIASKLHIMIDGEDFRLERWQLDTEPK